MSADNRPADTSEDVHRMRIEALRAMTPAQRVAIAIDMSELAMQIKLAATKRQEVRAKTADDS